MRLAYYRDKKKPESPKDEDTLFKQEHDWRYNNEKHYLERKLIIDVKESKLAATSSLDPQVILENLDSMNIDEKVNHEEQWIWAPSPGN